MHCNITVSNSCSQEFSLSIHVRHFDRSHMTSYYCSIAIRTYLSYCLRDTAKILVENQKNFISHLYLMPLMKVTPSYFADQLIEKI